MRSAMRTLFALATIFFVSTTGIYVVPDSNGDCQPGFKYVAAFGKCENWYVFVSFKRSLIYARLYDS